MNGIESMKRTTTALLPLVVMTNWSLFLLIFRMVYYQSTYYDFLLWNTFLAWIPIGISFFLYVTVVERRKQIAQWLLYSSLLVWIFFLPNTPYLITDFVHLMPRGIVPLWYDVLLLLSFSLLGLFQFEYSIVQIREVIKIYYKPSKLYKWVIPVTIILMSIGIYGGRFLRWNSWEVVTNPLSLITETLIVIQTSYMFTTAMAYIVGMSVLLALFHYLVHTVGKLSRGE